MNIDRAPLTAQARYKQILAELAELYERREYLKRGKGQPAPEPTRPELVQPAPASASPAARSSLEVLPGGRRQRTADDDAARQHFKSQLVLIHGGRSD